MSVDSSSRVERYLDRRGLHRSRRLEPESIGGLDEVDQVVVIPTLAEPARLMRVLGDLQACPVRDRQRTLVICTVNNRSPQHAPASAIKDNQETLRLLARPATSAGLRLAWIDASSPGAEIGPRQGVGTARRLGLDHGLTVLHRNRVRNGMLISLDADCRVQPSYLRAVREHHAEEPIWAAVISYAHPLPDEPDRRRAMTTYEIFLRGHELGLCLARSDYAYPAIGSTVVCSSEAYVAAGGMNQRQAGEDFYFLQELRKTGHVCHITTTTVSPSPRCSDRVPFGTGAAIRRQLSGRHDAQLYHPTSYGLLGQWLELARSSLDLDGRALLHRARSVDQRLSSYLDHQGLERAWDRMRANAPDSSHLLDHLMRWFDGFRTLKLLHYLRDHGHPDLPATEVAAELMRCAATTQPTKCDQDPEQLLAHLRALDRDRRGLHLPGPRHGHLMSSSAGDLTPKMSSSHR